MLIQSHRRLQELACAREFCERTGNNQGTGNIRGSACEFRKRMGKNQGTGDKRGTKIEFTIRSSRKKSRQKGLKGSARWSLSTLPFPRKPTQGSSTGNYQRTTVCYARRIPNAHAVKVAYRDMVKKLLETDLRYHPPPMAIQEFQNTHQACGRPLCGRPRKYPRKSQDFNWNRPYRYTTKTPFSAPYGL